MADNSPMLVLAVAAISFVGSLIGGLISPLLLEHRKQASEQRKRRADKLEKLVTVLNEHEHWISQTCTKLALGEKQGKEYFSPAPLTKAETITKIYFPKLVDPVAQLVSTAREFETRIALVVATDINSSELYSGNAYTKYRDARDFLWKVIDNFVQVIR